MTKTTRSLKYRFSLSYAKLVLHKAHKEKILMRFWNEANDETMTNQQLRDLGECCPLPVRAPGPGFWF